MSNLDILQQRLSEEAPSQHGLSLSAIALLVGVALTVLVFGIALVRQQQGQPTTGPAPDFTLTTFDGETFNLSEQGGKVVAINFWENVCAPCIEQQNDFERIINAQSTDSSPSSDSLAVTTKPLVQSSMVC